MAEKFTATQRTILACLRTAVDDRTFWTPCDAAPEKRAAKELATRGLCMLASEGTGKTLWVAPTRQGLTALGASEVGHG